jgi:hypothetical protein
MSLYQFDMNGQPIQFNTNAANCNNCRFANLPEGSIQVCRIHGGVVSDRAKYCRDFCCVQLQIPLD